MKPNRFALAACLMFFSGFTAAEAQQSAWVQRGASGRLIYTPDAQGDRVPDFSDVGYRGGRVALPTVTTAVTVQPIAGDDTASVQAAIDLVSALPLGPDGFRGAVELGAGQFEIAGQLTIGASGVVLRGAGRDAGGTVLRATGTGQRDLIRVLGSGSQTLVGSTRNFIDKTVPVGARSFRVDSTSGFSVGDTVRVERPSTANWISDLGMDMIPPRDDGGTTNQWTAGSFNIRYDRVITRIEGDRIFVDAPLTNAFEQQYGGGTIKRYTWDSRIENVGIESLRAESDFAFDTDEDHAWNFVTIDDAQHVWVRDTASANFGRSAVLSHPGAKWVTVDNAINETPKSEITGGRRYTFDLSGQLELVTNSVANEGRHDFVNNSTRPAGPHVFHNSVANNALDESGPHQRWATGSLFDKITVDGDQINARNRGNFGTGHGWAGANMVIWNSEADSYIVQNPPTAQNWLVGSVGDVIEDTTFGSQPAGYIDSHGAPVEIDSLYEAQVADAAQVTHFEWAGDDSNWGDPQAWRQKLVPAAYEVETRDYLIGDIDDFVDDGASSVDNAPIDADWEDYIENTSANPITGFDDASGNVNVAFTIGHQLDPSERVVHASLALSLKQSGGAVASDFVRLFDSSPENRRSFADLGWDSQVNASEAFVGVLDLGGDTDHLQGGEVNVQINDDTSVDWALYTVTVASELVSSGPPSVSVVGGGEATVDADVGAVTTLTVGGPSEGALHLTASGELDVQDTLEVAPNGTLRFTLEQSAAATLQVLGDASLDGQIELTHAAGYAPEWGDFRTLLSVDGTLTGLPNEFVAPALGDGLAWRLFQSDALLFATVVLQGDYNGDGVVDAADYTVWRDTLDSTDQLAADGDGNGVVDQADYDLWRNAFGAVAPTASISVPEPTSFCLVLACLGVITKRRSTLC